MTVAQVLFLGSVLFCGQADSRTVCTPDGVVNGQPARVLVLNLTADGYQCNSAGCGVCNGARRIGRHLPYMVFEEADLANSGTCRDNLARKCRGFPKYCCIELAGHRISFSGTGTLTADDKPRGYESPPDQSSDVHEFGWIGSMDYFRPGLELLEDRTLLAPSSEDGSRVVSWIDFDGGDLHSTLFAREEELDSHFVLWKPYPRVPGKARTALAEAVLWSTEVSQPFKVTVESESETKTIELDGDDPHVVFLNLPDVTLGSAPGRQEGGRFAPHFMAYYNLFEGVTAPCPQPSIEERQYYTGGFSPGVWLSTGRLQPLAFEKRLKELGPAEGALAGVAALLSDTGGGDNAVCSPSKFP